MLLNFYFDLADEYFLEQRRYVRPINIEAELISSYLPGVA